MSTTERTKLPPVVCSPWCTYNDGDGHADAVCAEDQSCIGDWRTIPLTRTDEGQISVMPWRSNGKQADVVMNVETDHVCS